MPKQDTQTVIAEIAKLEGEARLTAENRALREGYRLPVSELLLASVSAHAATEGVDAAGEFDAVVGEMDMLNGNHRVYTKGEWAGQINRANRELCPEGTLLGAVDHQGCAEGGNLKTTPIIWKGLQAGEATTSREARRSGRLVVGSMKIADTAAGKDLKELIKAGANIGFSTFGFADGREPTDDERRDFGIAEDDERAVIIENWELVKIDAVDNPSVRKARLIRRTESQQGGAPPTRGNAVDIKTLEELKAKFADLLKGHQIVTDQVVTDATANAAKVTALEAEVQPLRDAKAKYLKLVKALGDSLTCLADEHGAERPYKEVTAKEADERIAAANTERDQIKAELATVKDQLKQANDKIGAAETETKERDRKAAVEAKVGELLKDHKFADVIRDDLAEAAKSAEFTAEKVQPLVEARNGHYEKLTSKLTPKPDAGILGVTMLNDDDDNKGDGLSTVASVAEGL